MAVKILYVTLAALLLNLVVAVHTAQWASLYPVMVSIIGVCFWLHYQRKAQLEK